MKRIPESCYGAALSGFEFVGLLASLTGSFVSIGVYRLTLSKYAGAAYFMLATSIAIGIVIIIVLARSKKL